jgi:mono/diheme cytochrome c family protein
MSSYSRGLSGLLAAGAALVLAGCPGEFGGGYEKVAFRDPPGLMLAAVPDPPPVIAGFGGAGPVTPILAAGAAPAGVTQEMVEEGQQLYGTVCVACHGAGGAGSAAAPALGDGGWLHGSGSFDEIVAIIQAGVPAPLEFAAPMPPLGGGNFSPEQVRAIAAYVFALSHQEGA